MQTLSRNWRRFGTKSLIGLLCLAGMMFSAAAAPTEPSRLTHLSRMMVALQVVTETYAVDHDGRYPRDLAALYQDATQQKYWVDTVKYTQKKPGGAEEEIQVQTRPVLYLDAGSTHSVTGIATIPSLPAEAVIYLRMAGDSEYCIFALDGQGGLLKDGKGRDFYLSNRDDAKLCRLS